jgi:hypothetical protein
MSHGFSCGYKLALTVVTRRSNKSTVVYDPNKVCIWCAKPLESVSAILHLS